MPIIPNIEEKAIDSVRIESQQKKKQEFRLRNSTKKNPGHILFSYNKVTKELKVAEMQNECVIMNLVPMYKSKVIIEKDCIYIQALNKKNAIKRIRETYYESNNM